MCQVLRNISQVLFPSSLYFVPSSSFLPLSLLAQDTNSRIRFPCTAPWISDFQTALFLSHIHFVTVTRMKFHLQFLSPIIAASPPIFLDDF